MSEISIRHLSKSYGDHLILDDVSLEVSKGDIFGVLGLSGAGKSTLVRCINGLETFDKGEIYFEDQLIATPLIKVDRVFKKKINMIFQSFNLLSQRDVLSNVLLALQISDPHQKKKEQVQLALEALSKVGLEDKIHAYPSELSGGQCQRVAIARSLVLRPQVLLSDEATSSLDPETTESILELLKKLNKELGLTIIMISHQIQAIESICTKVSILSDSRIVEQGELSDVFLNPKTDIAKNLIYSSHVKTMLDSKRMIRLLFDGNLDEPIIANIIQDCSILVSIVYADTKVIDRKMYGQVVIKLPEKESETIKLEKYLTLHRVRYEEVSK
ncbi:MAG: methionine ABC transporter ATP-binding protein [Bacilli bacterium]